jgi:uncharacterized membrane protein
MSEISEKSLNLKDGEKSLIASEKNISPYPSPEILNGYEQVQKGFAERLMKMAEDERKDRSLRADKTIELAHKREHTTRWGLIIGLVAVLPIYGISFYAFNLGHAVEAASIIVGSTIANLAGIFVARKTGLFDDKKSES